VDRTASYALSNLFSGLFLEWSKYGNLAAYISQESGMRKGVYLYKGQLTNEILSKKFDLSFKEIEFLIPPHYFSI